METAQIVKPLLKIKKIPDVKAGDTVRVFESVREGNKTRVAIFEGLVLARKHGSEPGASITVRKISKGIGIERVFPLYSPAIEKFEIVRRAKVRRAKLFYMRKRIGKKAMLKGELLPPGTEEAAKLGEEQEKVEQEVEEFPAENAEQDEQRQEGNSDKENENKKASGGGEKGA